MPRDLGFGGSMGQDLASDELALHHERSLGVHTADSAEAGSQNNAESDDAASDTTENIEEASEVLKQLHPYASSLGLGDIESCVALENACFEEVHRASREKLTYRLSRCSQLCLGLFTSAGPDSPQQQAATASSANLPDSNDPKRKTVLLAHIIATKGSKDKVTDDDMAIPGNWENDVGGTSADGHQDEGRTLCLHSLAVLPEYQGKGLGKILMKSYIQRMLDADLADRVAIITYQKLIPFYESFGFTNKGKSEAQFGGGGWYDMVVEFDNIRPDDSEDEYEA